MSSLLHDSSGLPTGTYTVSQLGEELQLILEQTLHGVWVAGEVRRVTNSRRGHVYFEIVEKGRGDAIVGSLQAVLFRRDYQRVRRVLERVGVELREGQVIRCFGGVDFYPPSGRLQLIARDVDPVFSLGDLARRRQETLGALQASGLIDQNQRLELPPLPLRVALVSSLGSAAERDFVTTIEASGYAFELQRFDVTVQGAAAEAEISAAFERLGQSGRAASSFDVVVLVRGGGSKTDLAAFDSLAIAEAVARCTSPVLAGLGHEIDESVVDLVAHRAFKTPTAVAEFLVRRVGEVELTVEALARRTEASASRRIAEASGRVLALELGLQRSSTRLRNTKSGLERLAQRLDAAVRGRTRDEGHRLDSLRVRLLSAARPGLRSADESLIRCAQSLGAQAGRLLSGARQRIEQQQRLVDSLAPERTLRRGFSITRQPDGRLVRDAAEVVSGTELVTELSRGSVRSRVEE